MIYRMIFYCKKYSSIHIAERPSTVDEFVQLNLPTVCMYSCRVQQYTVVQYGFQLHQNLSCTVLH